MHHFIEEILKSQVMLINLLLCLIIR